MKTKTQFLTCLIILPWLAIVGTAAAQTQVSGTISGETWTAANSPYQVIGNINVADLIIQPGVQISFQGNYSFEVDGRITAQGTELSPIVFMGTNGGWQGIFFNYSSPGSIMSYCVVSNAINSGIRILNSTPSLQYCRVANNTAPNYGGGIYVSLATNYYLNVQGCEVLNNACYNNSTYGGGMFFSGSGLIQRCIVESNYLYGGAGTMSSASEHGAGIWCQTGSLTISNCIISGNTVAAGGCCNPYLAKGGGLSVGSGSCAVANTIIDHNVSSGDPEGGAGVYIYAAATNVSFVNSTIVYNNIDGIYSESGFPTILNSIVYFNANNGTQLIGVTNVTYSDIANGFSGTGNINFNPVFLGTTNLIIVDGSPCVDAGNPNPVYDDSCFPPSLGTVVNDIGADGGPGGCNWPAGWPPLIEIVLNIPKTNILETVPWLYTPMLSGGTGSYTFGLSNAPSGMSVNPSAGTISWTPTQAQANYTYSNITYAVYESGNTVAWTNFNVTVLVSNTTPIFQHTIATQTVYATTLMQVTDSATNTDIWATSLNYAVVSGPTGVSVNPATGVVSWTPTVGQAGASAIYISATDYDPYAINSQSLGTTNSFQVQVLGVAPPAFTSQPTNNVVSFGSSFTFTASATGFPNPSYQWQFSTNGVTWVNISGATGSYYSLVSSGQTNIGYYRVEAFNSQGTNFSSVANLGFLNIYMYAGLNVYGAIGAGYTIQSTPNLTSNWATVTNLFLPTQPYIYIDYTSPTNSKQFYRVIPQ